ncbi:MAG: DUF1918 domain-containing protein [Acidimicrobiales bacterium]
MVSVGARVEVESERVGAPARTGTVTAVRGPIVQVRWDESGAETSFVPAAGSMRPLQEDRPKEQ